MKFKVSKYPESKRLKTHLTVLKNTFLSSQNFDHISQTNQGFGAQIFLKYA